MDPVLIATFSVAVALAALIVGMITSLRRDIGQRLDGIEERIDSVCARLDSIDARLRAVEQRLAELKGKLAFIENYILRRNQPTGREASMAVAADGRFSQLPSCLPIEGRLSALSPSCPDLFRARRCSGRTQQDVRRGLGKLERYRRQPPAGGLS